MAKKPTTVKVPKAPKAPKAKKAAAPPALKASPPSNVPAPDPKARELALSHRDKFLRLHKALASAQSNMRLFGKEVKEDGFSMRQVKLMVELSTPEGEAAWRSLIASDLIAAQWQGAGIGQQLVLFLEPDRTPSTDIAYDEGQQASMTGGSPKPTYHPSVPQFQRWLDGYHDHQATLADGFQMLEPNGGGFIPISAEELAAQQAEAKAAAAGPSRTKEMAAKRASAALDEIKGNA
jgi:hypothetical protein